MKAVKPGDPKRSALMSRVRQRGTKAELVVASILRQLGLSYRLNVRSLPGSPDFANKRRKWAVFVNGCFWHQHPGCPRATIPKTNANFWQEKFRANQARDERATGHLEDAGFRVVVVWECEVEDLGVVRERLQRSLKRVE